MTTAIYEYIGRFVVRLVWFRFGGQIKVASAVFAAVTALGRLRDRAPHAARGLSASPTALLRALPCSRAGVGPDLRGDVALLLAGERVLRVAMPAVELPGGGEDLVRAAGARATG